jgi:hypothetical protein
MIQADQIRQFAFDNCVAPARAARRIEVVIRAGDVHREMSLANAMPAVCSALGGRKFEEFAGVTIVERSGPLMGANMRFRISLTAAPSSGHVRASASKPVSAPKPVRADLDLANSIVLVSCVKSKLAHPAQARSLYVSAWFQKARAIVEASGARWFVLSSLYGLVAPETEIAPYDWTLNTLGVADRRRWANKVLDKLLSELRGERRVVMIAGARYREFLIEPLRRRGIVVEAPLEGLRRGEQLKWLSKHE